MELWKLMLPLSCLMTVGLCSHDVVPKCSSTETTCEFDLEVSHRYTMAEYKGSDHYEVYSFKPLRAMEDGKLYRLNCDGTYEPEPLTDAGKIKI